MPTQEYITTSCEGCPLYIESLTEALLLSDLMYLSTSDDTMYELEGVPSPLKCILELSGSGREKVGPGSASLLPGHSHVKQ